MQLQTALFFHESREDIFARIYREFRPSATLPRITVLYRRYANANARAHLRDGELRVSISDLLEGAPAPIVESLAWILLSKMFRHRPPAQHLHRYRLYLNRKEMRRDIHIIRASRGRKNIQPPRGKVYDLEPIFEELNQAYFHGLMARPILGWTGRQSRTLLGHYDPSHNAIVLSSILDHPHVPRIAVEYVLYHEMLHLRFPVEHRGSRRCVHTPEFKEAERLFPGLTEAKEALKRL